MTPWEDVWVSSSSPEVQCAVGDRHLWSQRQPAAGLLARWERMSVTNIHLISFFNFFQPIHLSRPPDNILKECLGTTLLPRHLKEEQKEQEKGKKYLNPSGRIFMVLV